VSFEDLDYLDSYGKKSAAVHPFNKANEESSEQPLITVAYLL